MITQWGLLSLGLGGGKTCQSKASGFWVFSRLWIQFGVGGFLFGAQAMVQGASGFRLLNSGGCGLHRLLTPFYLRPHPKARRKLSLIKVNLFCTFVPSFTGALVRWIRDFGSVRLWREHPRKRSPAIPRARSGDHA